MAKNYKPFTWSVCTRFVKSEFSLLGVKRHNRHRQVVAFAHAGLNASGTQIVVGSISKMAFTDDWFPFQWKTFCASHLKSKTGASYMAYLGCPISSANSMGSMKLIGHPTN